MQHRASSESVARHLRQLPSISLPHAVACLLLQYAYHHPPWNASRMHQEPSEHLAHQCFRLGVTSSSLPSPPSSPKATIRPRLVKRRDAIRRSTEQSIDVGLASASTLQVTHCTHVRLQLVSSVGCLPICGHGRDTLCARSISQEVKLHPNPNHPFQGTPWAQTFQSYRSHGSHLNLDFSDSTTCREALVTWSSGCLSDSFSVLHMGRHLSSHPPAMELTAVTTVISGVMWYYSSMASSVSK